LRFTFGNVGKHIRSIKYRSEIRRLQKDSALDIYDNTIII